MIGQSLGRFVLAFTVVSLATVSAGSIALAQNRGKTTNDAVYSAAQAKRGSTLFAGTCTNCHDTTRFSGPDFVKQWTGEPLHALFDVMKTTMPEDNPGSLKPQQYADIVAYFLQLNAYPAGETDLAGTDEAMKAIKIDAPKAKK